jgi:hypothetical protein
VILQRTCDNADVICDNADVIMQRICENVEGGGGGCAARALKTCG